jgi:hypothetical protein
MNAIRAALSVFVSICAGLEKYALAFSATGDMVHRIAKVGDKHVEQWEIEQDAVIAQAKRKALEA